MKLWSKNKHLSLVCEIGSGGVGAALVVMGGRKPHVLYSKTSNFQPKKISDAKTFEKEVKRTLDVLLDEIVVQGLRSPEINKITRYDFSSVFCSASAPWYVAKTKFVVIEKKEPFVVTNRLIEEILDEEEKKFKKEAEENIFGHVFKEGIQMIERSVTDVSLNGYRTENPISKETVSLELSVYMSIIPRTIVFSLEDKIGKRIHVNKFHFSTFPLTLVNSIEKVFNKEDNFGIFHVGAEATDVSFVENGMFSDTLSVEIGSNSIIRAISKAFSIPFDVATSFLNIYSGGEIDSQTGKKIEEVIEKHMDEWSDVVSKVGINKTLPFNIYLVTEEKFVKIFKNILDKVVFGDNKSSNIKILPVTVSALTDLLFLNRGVKYDAPLLLSIVGAGVVLEKGRKESLQ